MAGNLTTEATGESQWMALHRAAFDAGFKPPGSESGFPRRSLRQSYANLTVEQKTILDPLINSWCHEHTTLLADTFESQDPDERDYKWMRSYLDGVVRNLESLRRFLDCTQALYTHIERNPMKPRAHLLEYLRPEHDTRKRQWDALSIKRRMTRGRLFDLHAHRQKGHLGTDWFEAWKLGTGTYGEAVAWFKQDHNGRIVDRLAIKNTELARNRILWTKDSVPTEVATMEQLGKIPEASSCIVKLRNWAIQRNRARARLYLEYCPFGDLSHFVSEYYWNQKPMVPEPFAWSVFYDMVRAGILMERGSLGPAVPDWRPIVHRDMKGPNVFLNHNATDEFKEYQSAKVGDFGLAVFPEAEEATAAYAYMCANCTIAPEVNTPMQRGIDGQTRISTKTNVWGVGNIMRVLLRAGRPDMDYAKAMDQNGMLTLEKPLEFHQYSPRFRQTYSNDLLHIVSMCQNVDPNRRPTFDFLMNYINERTAGNWRDKAGKLRSAPRGDPQWRQHQMTYTNDKAIYGALARDLKLKDNKRAPPQPKPRVKRPRAEADIPSPISSLGGEPGRGLPDLRPEAVVEAERLAAEAAQLAKDAQVGLAANGDNAPQRKKRKTEDEAPAAAVQQSNTMGINAGSASLGGVSRSSTASITQGVANAMLSAVPARMNGGQGVPPRRPVPAPGAERTMPIGPRPMQQVTRPVASPLSPSRRGLGAGRRTNATAMGGAGRGGSRRSPAVIDLVTPPPPPPRGTRQNVAPQGSSTRGAPLKAEKESEESEEE